MKKQKRNNTIVKIQPQDPIVKYIHKSKYNELDLEIQYHTDNILYFWGTHCGVNWEVRCDAWKFRGTVVNVDTLNTIAENIRGYFNEIDYKNFTTNLTNEKEFNFTTYGYRISGSGRTFFDKDDADRYNDYDDDLESHEVIDFTLRFFLKHETAQYNGLDIKYSHSFGLFLGIKDDIAWFVNCDRAKLCDKVTSPETLSTITQFVSWYIGDLKNDPFNQGNIELDIDFTLYGRRNAQTEYRFLNKNEGECHWAEHYDSLEKNEPFYCIGKCYFID
jgi:hypothetical protein